ncbi:ankrd1 [Symbiodinium sp. CCMP2592]|nr:ankrd1 [Symbiodinium sp. CCMP2592]
MEPSEERRQVLHYAAVHGRADLISLAIEQEIAADPTGASPEKVTKALLAWQNEDKGTALHEACRAGHVDVVRLLLLRGAPANERDALGRAAYQVAASEGPAERSSQLRAAFEAELFKRCAQGDLAGAEALAVGGIDLNCEQAGYSPWAWADLFGQSSLAERMQELAHGGGASEAPLPEAPPGSPPPLSGSARSVGSLESASASSSKPSSAPSRPAHLPLWPAMSAYLDEDEDVWLGGRQVTVFMPLLDWTRAGSLRDELSFCLQALCGEGGCEPQLRVPGGRHGSDQELHVDVWMDEKSGSGSSAAYELRVQSSELHVTAGSLQALYVALESLRQLLKFHAGAGGSLLRLPRLHAWGRLGPGLFGVFLELWRLEPQEQVLALRQLRGRGARQIWAPVPTLCDGGLAPGPRIWQLRRTCSELDVELVPILASSASIELLAQFQGCSQIGCRSGEPAELAAIWQKMMAAGLLVEGAGSSARLCAVLDEAAAPSAKPPLPASSARRLEDLLACEGGIPSSRFAVLFETRLEANAEVLNVRAVKAASRLQARGVSSGLLVRSPSTLPFHVWHWQPLPGTAAALAQLTRQVQLAQLSEVLLEVPVFGAPWAGPGTAWRPSWCPLFAFLAGAQDAEALEALQQPSSRRLLLCGLVKDAPSEELARELWESSAELPQTADSVASALRETPQTPLSPSDFLRSLLELLAGLLPRSLDEDRDGCISSANAWYAHLSERRQRLREFLEGHEAVSQHERAKCELLPESRLLIASALTGVEWLRFSCRLLLLLAKHCEKQKAKESKLHAALQALPPAKGSDVRNGFLSLLHQTSSEFEEIETPESEVSLPLQAAQALWQGGLRLGAALDLPPWKAAFCT